MRKLLLGGAMALGLSTGGAMAAALGMNEAVLADGTDMDTCKQMGVAAIAKAGLKPAGSSPASVIGAPRPTRGWCWLSTRRRGRPARGWR